MEKLWMEILVEILCGVAGGFIFLWLVLFFLRPSIRISRLIAKQPNSFEDDSPFTFVFKIINRSLFPAYEIQLELFEVNFYPAYPNGLNKRFKEIPLKRNHLKQIIQRPLIYNKSHTADHCVAFRTNHDLEKILTDPHKALQLQVTLKHGFSGLSKAFKMDFRSIASIKQGHFKFAEDCDIS